MSSGIPAKELNTLKSLARGMVILLTVGLILERGGVLLGKREFSLWYLEDI